MCFNDLYELEEYIHNPKNYNPTHKKQYSIWCAKPQEGTEIYNKLEQFSANISSAKPYVLSGTQGEMWIVDLDCLMRTYTFEDGTEITPEGINNLRTNYIFEHNELTAEDISNLMANDIVDWFKITTKPNSSPKWACFVPKEYVFQLDTSLGAVWCNKESEGVNHGLGDFVVCNSKDNKPDLDDPWIVNGSVFANTYDNTGFEDCIAESLDINCDVPKPTMVII